MVHRAFMDNDYLNNAVYLMAGAGHGVEVAPGEPLDFHWTQVRGVLTTAKRSLIAETRGRSRFVSAPR